MVLTPFVQSSSAGSSGAYAGLGPFSPLNVPAYNQLAASSLLNQQYAAALGLGKSVSTHALLKSMNRPYF